MDGNLSLLSVTLDSWKHFKHFAESCKFQEDGGFLKQVCSRPRDEKTFYKCHNTEEYYWSIRSLQVSALCSDDLHYYQACGKFTVDNMMVTNGNILCGGFMCKIRWGNIWNTFVYDYFFCNGKSDCVNTELDEEGCSDMITMPSGNMIVSNRKKKNSWLYPILALVVLQDKG